MKKGRLIGRPWLRGSAAAAARWKSQIVGWLLGGNPFATNILI
jgi:hypothetical protein